MISSAYGNYGIKCMATSQLHLYLDALYTSYMTQLQDICFRMDNNHAGSLIASSARHQTYTQTLQYIQVACMDPESEARYIDELQRMRMSDRQTRDLIDEVRGELSGTCYAILSVYRRHLQFLRCYLVPELCSYIFNQSTASGTLHALHE